MGATVTYHSLRNLQDQMDKCYTIAALDKVMARAAHQRWLTPSTYAVLLETYDQRVAIIEPTRRTDRSGRAHLSAKEI